MIESLTCSIIQETRIPLLLGPVASMIGDGGGVTGIPGASQLDMAKKANNAAYSKRRQTCNLDSKMGQRLLLEDLYTYKMHDATIGWRWRA
jgi:hypothetical protein